MSTFISGWYVLYTKPRHEKKVSEGLTNAKIESYLPTVRSLRKWHDRRKYIDMPLFQSYVFVKLKNLKEYYDGLRVQGVLEYVRFGKEIARVADAVINELKLLVGSGNEIEVSATYFPPGQKLYIQDGPLTGILGEVVEVDNEQKVLVRIQLLQRNLLIALPSAHLIAVSG